MNVSTASIALHDSFSPNRLNEEVQLPPLFPQFDRVASLSQEGRSSRNLEPASSNTNNVSVIGDHSVIEVNFVEDSDHEVNSSYRPISSATTFLSSTSSSSS